MSRVHELAGEHLEFWRERHLCTVTTIRRNGSPHVVPMGVMVDTQNDSEWGVAWAITSRTSQKVANLLRSSDPRVAVCQVDGRRWSTIEGTAEVRDDPESVAEAVRRYVERYQQPRENPARVAIRISITAAIGNL